MATPNIVPRADSEGQLGTSSKYWAAAYIDFVYVGAGKIGRDADNLIDFSTDNIIKFRVNNGNELELDAGNLYPATDDGLALGYVDNGFSDLFLASGAVINFDNSDVTLTHSSNTLVLDGGDFKFRTSKKAVFGDAGNVQIYSDNTHGYIINNTTDGDLLLMSDDGSGGETAYLTLDGSAAETKFHKDLRIIDNEKLILGTSNDMEMFHNGTNTTFNNYNGHLYIINYADDKDVVFQSDDGSGGVTTYFQLDGGEGRTVFKQNAIWQDNKAIYIGDGADLQINHNGTDSQVTNTTGNLQFTNTADDKDISFASDNGAGGDAIYFYLDGSSATHDGSATTALYTNWPDNSRISFGTSHDLQIYHNATNSVISNAVGNLYISNHADDKDIVFECDNGSGGSTAYLTLDGGLGYTVASKDIQLSDNVNLAIGNGPDAYITHTGTVTNFLNYTGNLQFTQHADDSNIIFSSDDGSGGVTAYLTLDGTNVQNVFQKRTVHQDSVEARFGNGSDMKIYHNSTDNIIETFSGDLYIKQQTDDKDIIFQCDDGSGGLATYFRLDGSSAGGGSLYTNWADNSRVTLGAGNDMQLYHDGSNNYVDITLGDLYFTNYADDKDIIFRGDDGGGSIITALTLDMSDAGTATFNHDVAVNDSGQLRAGNSGDLYLLHDATNSYLQNETGDLYIQNGANGKDIILRSDDGSNGQTAYLTLDGSAGYTIASQHILYSDNVKALFGTAGDLKIYHDGTDSVVQNDTGDLEFQNRQDDGDIVFKSDDGSGGVTEYFRLDGGLGYMRASQHLEFIDNKKASFGTDGDLQIYHDGSHSYIDEVGTGDLIISADNDLKFMDRSSNIMANMNAANSVELYFGGVKKFETTATGISVTGAGGTDGAAGSPLLRLTNTVDSTDWDVDDVVGSIEYYSADASGNAPYVTAFIKSINEQDNGTLPSGSLSFGTATYNASGGAIERMRIDQNGDATFAGTITSTSATGTAVGGGLDASAVVTINVGEINSEIITTIFVDLAAGTDSVLSSSTAGDVIGNDGTAGAHLTQITTAINGIVYKGEMICLELPTTGDPDINLVAAAAQDIAEDAPGEDGNHVLINGGVATLAKHYPSITVPTDGIQDDFLYLTHGGTTAGTYNRGKFLIRLFGAKTTGL